MMTSHVTFSHETQNPSKRCYTYMRCAQFDIATLDLPLLISHNVELWITGTRGNTQDTTVVAMTKI